MNMERARECPLISVVVPAYNVAEYLEECMDSLLGQTYRQLEILLVDDGSTDETGKFCDLYAGKDPRVIVIHKENGGLSDARNAGLARATGDYIGFTDPDDYIEKDMFERLLALCRDHGTAMARARFDTFGEPFGMPLVPADGEVTVFRGDTFLSNIISYSERYPSSYSVWTGLYERSITEGIRFPAGKHYEDIGFTTKTALKAGKVAYLNGFLYHYRVRTGSISHQRGALDKRLITDRMTERDEQILYLEREGKRELADLARSVYFPELLHLAAKNPYPEYDEMIREVMQRWRLTTGRIFRLPESLPEKCNLVRKNLFPEAQIRRYRRKSDQ